MLPGSPPFHHNRIKRSFLAVLALVFGAATLVYNIAWIAAAHWGLPTPPVELGFGTHYIMAESVQFVESVYPGSPAEKAGLLSGDEILAFNGKRIENEYFLNKIWNLHKPGDTVQLTIKRSGKKSPFTVVGIFRQRQARGNEDSLPEYIADEVRKLFPIPFVVVGLIILLLRWDDPQVWLLALLFGAFSATPGIPEHPGFPLILRSFVLGYHAVFLNLLGPLFYFFFAVFPIRSPIDGRLPWLKWLGVALGFYFASQGFQIGNLVIPDFLATIVGTQFSTKIITSFVLVFFALGFTSLILNIVRTTDIEARRKIRLMLWGTGVGICPSLINVALNNFVGFQTSFWLSTALVLSLFFWPLSFGYVVVKHRVLEIPILLKRTARYLLVQRGFTVFVTLVCAGLTVFLAMSITRYLQKVIEGAQSIGFTLSAFLGGILLWGGLQVHRRISGRIDRAFFRSAYDARVILEQLAERTAIVKNREDLASLLEYHLKEAFQPSTLVIYLRENEDYFVAVSGAVPPQSKKISARLSVLTELTSHGQLRETASIDYNGVVDDTVRVLINSECLVPMMTRGNQMMGFFVLGSKRSEELYSGQDKRLLISVAGQAATALHNIYLAEEIAERTLVQERKLHDMDIERRLLEADNSRKTKELEEARALQLSMLPRTLPELPDLDIAVYMKTAAEVGGDYYDFAVAPNGTLTIAIGDATGHGIKAGMMVAVTKSLFDDYANIPNIPEVFNKYTSSIKKLDLHSLYMAMLLVRIKDKRLVASSAGIPSPLIYRAATGEVEELVLKGMPLGCFQQFPYEQKKTNLFPGDTVVLMTDGLSERFNDKKEVFGYTGVKEVIGKVGHKSPQEIIDSLSTMGEEWSNGEPQNDDITMVVVQIKNIV